MTAPRAARVETPADTLRRAAAKVRELASKAPGGPWHLDSDAPDPDDEEHEWRVGCAGPDEFPDMGGWFVASEVSRGFAEYAALMGPQIAEPLASWLYAEAALADLREGSMLNPEITEPAEALTLARALLASPVPEPDGEGTT